ncbi:ankyrin repeat protein [Trichuris suis]|nr:ankyrin repeat protein [Trichuris suis]
MISGAQSHALLEDLESSIISWLDRGDVKNLEKLVLLGFGDMMLGLIDQARHRASIKFLRQLPSYQAKIDAIHHAVERKDLQTLKELVKKNKLALARDRFGTTVLQKAVMNNDFNTVVWLLNKFPRVVDVQDNDKRTALHYAAVLSSHEGDKIYQFLLNAGANLQIKDRDGRTPKDYLQNPHLVDHLVHRTDSSKQDQTLPQHFNYLLSLWLREGRVMKLAQLVFSGCGDVLLGRQSSHPASQSFLQEVSFHLEKISKIHEAVKSGDMAATQMLATAKKWAIARNRQGETPLHTAVNNDRLDILKYLLQKFPETVNAKDYQLRTPLHYAAGRGVDNECYKYLLEAGADENSKDCDGRKPKYYITHPESLRVKLSRSPSAEVHNNSDASSLDSQDSLEITTSSGHLLGNKGNNTSDILENDSRYAYLQVE